MCVYGSVFCTSHWVLHSQCQVQWGVVGIQSTWSSILCSFITLSQNLVKSLAYSILVGTNEIQAENEWMHNPLLWFYEHHKFQNNIRKKILTDFQKSGCLKCSWDTWPQNVNLCIDTYIVSPSKLQSSWYSYAHLEPRLFILYWRGWLYSWITAVISVTKYNMLHITNCLELTSLWPVVIHSSKQLLNTGSHIKLSKMIIIISVYYDNYVIVLKTFIFSLYPNV